MHCKSTLVIIASSHVIKLLVQSSIAGQLGTCQLRAAGGEQRATSQLAMPAKIAHGLRCTSAQFTFPMARRRGKAKRPSASDNGPTCGNQGTSQAATGDDDELAFYFRILYQQRTETFLFSDHLRSCRSSDLDDLFAKLSLVEPGDRMACLDAGLAKYCEHGKHHKKHIKEKGICLSDCQPYGIGLKQVLKRDANKRVCKKDAKHFPYVKKCLVFLG